MSERRQGNRTERLQARLRNYKWRDLYGSHAVRQRRFSPEPIASGTIIKGDPKRRAKYRQETIKTQQILDSVLELSAEGRSAVEILDDLGFPSHSTPPDTME